MVVFEVCDNGTKSSCHSFMALLKKVIRKVVWEKVKVDDNEIWRIWFWMIISGAHTVELKHFCCHRLHAVPFKDFEGHKSNFFHKVTIVPWITAIKCIFMNTISFLFLQVHLRSHFIMNGVCVRWKGWLDLDRLDGVGCLEYDEETAQVNWPSNSLAFQNFH